MMKLEKSREVKDDKNSPPPLSLANVLLLQEGPPTPWINRSTKKPTPESLANLLLHKFATLTQQLKRTATSQYCFRPRRDSFAGYILTNITNNWFEDTHIHRDRELPTELWGEIGKRLSSRLDILRFRSVCKIWRASLPSPTRFPLWVPPLPIDMDPEQRLCIITEVSVFYQSNWDGTAIVLEEVGQGGKFYAHRLFTGYAAAKIDLPQTEFTSSSWSSWRRRPFPYDRLSFISKAHHLRRALPRTDDPTKLDYHFNSVAQKIVILKSARDGVNPSYDKQSDLSVVALVSEGYMKGRLALLRLRGSPETWAWDTDFCTDLFLDISNYKGRLCAIDPLGGFVVMDFDNSGLSAMTQISGPSPTISSAERKLLFEDCGELYLGFVYMGQRGIILRLAFGKNITFDLVEPPEKRSEILAHSILRGRLLWF